VLAAFSFLLKNTSFTPLPVFKSNLITFSFDFSLVQTAPLLFSPSLA